MGTIVTMFLHSKSVSSQVWGTVYWSFNKCRHTSTRHQVSIMNMSSSISSTSDKCDTQQTSSTNTRQFEDPSHSVLYMRVRPQPPESMVNSILTFLGRKPKLAVDLGCGRVNIETLVLM